jgi:hypothetical protein
MHSQGSRRTFHLALVAALTAGVLVFATTSASGGLLVQTAPSCAPKPVTQPFKRFGDQSSYTLVPGGTFEGAAAGWSLSNARVVAGNETFYAHAPGDSRSLSLSPWGSATSPTMCVGLEHPTMRFFARSSGFLPLLSVEVITRTSAGLKVPVPLGVVAPSASWRPTQRLIVLANLLPLLPNNYTPVSFRLRAVSGNWFVDDVYLDPKRH